LDLSQSHIEYLASRGITDPAVINSRGYRTVTDSNDLKGLGYSDKQSAHVPGLLLPIFNSKGKVVKFDRPYGQIPCLNVNPLMAAPLRQGGFHPLIIVEGVTRADALAQRGVPAAAIMGIYGWKGDTGSGPQVLSELHELPIKGREVWIFPDGDALTNPGVNAGVRALVDVFKRRGARSVYVGVVPGGLGLDDWLGLENDVTELQTLLTQSSDLPVVLAPRSGTSEIASRDELPETTDRDLAEAWLEQGAQVAYIPALDSWTAFLNGRWQQDSSGNVARVSLSTYLADIANRYVDGAKGADEVKAAKDTDRTLKSLKKLNDVLGSAAALSQAHAVDEDFDQDPWLFNCANGTLDLKTGFLKDHDPEDKLRGISPTTWDPAAKAPTFARFLDEVLPDPEVRAYLQVILGLSLVGKPILHILPVFVGSGRNGKGTLIHALTHTLGTDYSGPVDKSLLISTKFESHPTKLMALKGKRFVMASETEQGDRFASASLKALTGGDAITARGMRQDQQSFMPSHSMVLMTNSLPEVDALDKAMWARLKLFQFTADFEGREDTTIGDRLCAESSGILNWLVAGARHYLTHGLPPEPLGVVMATGDWRMDENSFLQFANERLVRDPKGLVTSGDLIDAYTRWAQIRDTEPLKGRALGAAIKAWGGQEKRTASHRQWLGIRFRDSSDGTKGLVTDLVTDHGEGSFGPTPPVTSSDAISNDGMTDVTQKIGVSPTTTQVPATTELEPMVPENPPLPSFRHSQGPDQGKQADRTASPSVMGDGTLSQAPWTRPMPYLD
jgi:putative DNA primase/helicase